MIPLHRCTVQYYYLAYCRQLFPATLTGCSSDTAHRNDIHMEQTYIKMLSCKSGLFFSHVYSIKQYYVQPVCYPSPTSVLSLCLKRHSIVQTL